MFDQIPLGFIIFIVCGSLTTIWLSKSIKKQQLPLPKGPPGVPLLGNLTSQSSLPIWEQYALWAKEYGTLFYLDIGGLPYMIINSFKDATSLLNKRSRIYSDRPSDTMSRLSGFNKMLFRTSSSDKRFAIMRRLIHSELGAGAGGGLDRHYEMFENETHGFLVERLKETPERWKEHIIMASMRPNMLLLYGYTPIYPPTSDILISAIIKAGMLAGTRNPGRYLVDSWPILRFVPRWLPGTEFLKKADELRRQTEWCFNEPLAFTRREIENGTATPSMASRLLSDPDISQDILKAVLGTLFIGSSDTTIATLEIFVLTMMLNPSVQRIAQVELDRFMERNGGRLPNVSDFEREQAEEGGELEYNMALMKEVMRWHPVGVMALPHRLTEEDTYEDMRIPKGTILMSNLWAMAHDESVYPDSFTFDPTRFIVKDKGSAQISQADPRNFAFGFGRRVCPGQAMAETLVFLAITSILSNFDITKPISSETGKEIEPVVEFIYATVVSHVKPFEAKFTLREGRGKTY